MRIPRSGLGMTAQEFSCANSVGASSGAAFDACMRGVDIPATSDIVDYCATKLGYDIWWTYVVPSFLYPSDMKACIAQGGGASQFGIPVGTVPPPFDPAQFAPGPQVDPNTGIINTIPASSQVPLTTPQQYGQWSNQNTPAPQPTVFDKIYAALPSGKTLLIIAAVVVGVVIVARSR